MEPGPRQTASDHRTAPPRQAGTGSDRTQIDAAIHARRDPCRRRSSGRPVSGPRQIASDHGAAPPRPRGTGSDRTQIDTHPRKSEIPSGADRPDVLRPLRPGPANLDDVEASTIPMAEQALRSEPKHRSGPPCGGSTSGRANDADTSSRESCSLDGDQSQPRNTCGPPQGAHLRDVRGPGRDGVAPLARSGHCPGRHQHARRDGTGHPGCGVHRRRDLASDRPREDAHAGRVRPRGDRQRQCTRRDRAADAVPACCTARHLEPGECATGVDGRCSWP